MKEFFVDKLKVKIMETRAEMGKVAACDIAQAIIEVLNDKWECNIIFAAAPSQNDMLQSLTEYYIKWDRINAFHMDEYVGLPLDAPQRFSNFLDNAIFKKASFKSVNYIGKGLLKKEDECIRYAKLLRQYPADIVCMGIGENGHIAFNDPHVALFNDPEYVKVVDLDDKCRQQQVNDGCFSDFNLVPKYAITLTIPALKADKVFCVVPAKTKAWAVNKMITGPIEENCPASILRTWPDATLYLDNDSSGLLHSQFENSEKAGL